jgi:hypothetical protein
LHPAPAPLVVGVAYHPGNYSVAAKKFVLAAKGSPPPDKNSAGRATAGIK